MLLIVTTRFSFLEEKLTKKKPQCDVTTHPFEENLLAVVQLVQPVTLLARSCDEETLRLHSIQIRTARPAVWWTRLILLLLHYAEKLVRRGVKPRRLKLAYRS